MRFFKKLKHDWLRWKQNFGKSTKKQVEEENPIQKAERLIRNLKLELHHLLENLAYFKASEMMLKSDINFFNDEINKNNRQINKVRKQYQEGKIQEEENKKSIEKYERENEDFIVEIEKIEQRKKDLKVEIKLMENSIKELNLKVSNYEMSLKLLITKIKILSTQINDEVALPEIKNAFQKLENLIQEAEHNKENIKEQSQND